MSKTLIGNIRGPQGVVTPALQALADAASAAKVAAEAARDAAQAVPTTSDGLVQSLISTDGTATRDALNATFERFESVLKYGVERDGLSSQTNAIRSALESKPNAAFYFPPGNYRLDTSLLVKACNSLVLAPGARIFAGAPMSRLIDYNPDLPSGQYAEDVLISGGLLDGANLADTVLSVEQIMRMTLTQFTIRDGVKRGIVTQPGLGAELLAYDGRLHNTSTVNVTDNVAIDNQMGDNHFHNIIIRDWTVGIRDNNGGRWDTIHPWLSGAHMAARFPTSVAFDLFGASNLISCFADTYRTAYKLNASSGRPRLRNARAGWFASLTDAIATANPMSVFDNTGEAGAFVYGVDVAGRAAAPASFISGGTKNMNVSDAISAGNVSGVADYYGGAKISTGMFVPTVFASSTSGTQTYGSRSGHFEVRRGQVTYRFTVSVEIGSDAVGNLRIGGLPMVEGAANVSVGFGNISTAYGATSAVGLTGANGSTTPLAAIPLDIAGGEISVTPLRGTTILLRGTITCPYSYTA